MPRVLSKNIAAWFGLAAALFFAIAKTRGQDPAPIELPPTDLSDSKPSTRPADRNSINGGMGLPGGGMGGPGGPGAPGYSATWYPSRPVTTPTPNGGPLADLGLIKQSVSAAVPVWKEGSHALMFRFGVSNVHFATNAVFPDSGRTFPINLWNINFGLNYMHKFEDGWTAGAMLGIDSASDRPFHSLRELNVSFMGFVQIPVQNDRDFWRLSLMYSPTGVLSFPIPGVAYQWNPNNQWSVGIGVPLSVTWRPTEEWNISMMYMPLTNVNARVTYLFTKSLSVYGGFQWQNEGYFLADRENTRDRLLLLEKRLITGITYRPWDHFCVDLNAGYAFDREMGIGQNQGTNLRDAVQVQPGAFIGINLRYGF